MNAKEVIEYYGSEVKAAASIGVSYQSVRNWRVNGKVPRISQLAIQTLTKGKLKADDDCFES